MNIRRFLVLFAVLTASVSALALDANPSRYVTENEVTFATGDTTVNKAGKVGTTISTWKFAADCTFKPTGSGATCVIRPTLEAADGGLDADWSYELPDRTKVANVTATSVILKVYGGLMLFFR